MITQRNTLQKPTSREALGRVRPANRWNRWTTPPTTTLTKTNYPPMLTSRASWLRLPVTATNDCLNNGATTHSIIGFESGRPDGPPAHGACEIASPAGAG